jgi:hypothetical protein
MASLPKTTTMPVILRGAVIHNNNQEPTSPTSSKAPLKSVDTVTLTSAPPDKGKPYVSTSTVSIKTPPPPYSSHDPFPLPSYSASVQAHPTAQNHSFHPMGQFMEKMGLKPEDFLSHGYFEKMSSGSVLWRKTGIPIAGTTTAASIIGLATGLGLKGTAAAVAVKGAFIGAGVSAGAAAGTGAGAGVIGSILLGLIIWTSRRTTKVMRNYRKQINQIKHYLMQEGNEDRLGLYLRTKQASSAKTKAKKANAKTLAKLDALQNPQMVQNGLYKVYVRYARNQNIVLLTRNPQKARELINKATMLADAHSA